MSLCSPRKLGKIFTHFWPSHLFSDGLVRKTTHQPSQRISPRKPAASDRRFWRHQMPMYKGEFQRAAKRRPIREARYLDLTGWTDQRAYNLLINGGFFVGVKSPTLPTFDPNLLEHPSMLKMCFCLGVWVGREFFLFSLNYQFLKQGKKHQLNNRSVGILDLSQTLHYYVSRLILVGFFIQWDPFWML